MSETTVTATWIILFLLPGLPLLLTWWKFATTKNSPSRLDSLIANLVLVLITGSLFWFFLGLFYKPLIGPGHSDRRFTTIYSNLAAVAAMAILVMCRKHPVRTLLALSAGAVCLVWLYLAGVSAAV